MIQHIIGLIGIIIGTATDVKTREVPDWVNYGMIASGIGFALFETFLQGSWLIILGSLAGVLAGYLLGALMYYTGQWGGGDAKMMMGLGALIGLPVTLAGWERAPFLTLFLLLTIVVGAVYGLVWMVFLMVAERKLFWPRFIARLHSKQLVRLRLAILILAVLLGGADFLFQGVVTLMILFIAALAYVTFYLALAVRSVEEACFVKKISVDKLVEGDWIVGEVRHKGEVIVPARNPGLTKKQLELLKKLGIKAVTVKEGIPFVPSFLIAYLAAWYWWTAGWPIIFWL